MSVYAVTGNPKYVELTVSAQNIAVERYRGGIRRCAGKPSRKPRLAEHAVLFAAAMFLPQCAPAPPHPTESAAPSTASTRSPAAATVDPVTAAELGASWQPACPVGPAELRRVTLDHIGFDGQPHRGELIVEAQLVPQVIEIFEQLHRLRYPIEKIRPASRYPGAADELSMADNNTSAFSCRRIPGTGHWAQHAFGRAIDVNPLVNPYIAGSGAFQPENAAAYLDRTHTAPGMLHDGDPAVRAFTDRGWRWGGHWKSPIDYQHFEQR